jgi:hypothetical protein
LILLVVAPLPIGQTSASSQNGRTGTKGGKTYYVEKNAEQLSQTISSVAKSRFGKPAQEAQQNSGLTNR